MEQIPNWLTDAINAAGLAVVYNADDWDFIVVPKQPVAIGDPSNETLPPTLH